MFRHPPSVTLPDTLLPSSTPFRSPHPTRRGSMVARHAASPAHVTPDPSRITAGSAALLVNAAAALLLLLPQQRSELPLPIRAIDPPTHVVLIPQTIIPTDRKSTRLNSSH